MPRANAAARPPIPPSIETTVASRGVHAENHGAPASAGAAYAPAESSAAAELLVAAEAWRAEVASRVSRYRSRHKSTVAKQESLALDFDSMHGDGGVADVPATASGAAHGAAHEAQQPEPAGHRGEMPRGEALERLGKNGVRQSGVDTKYYRRLNAEALEQAASVATARATATALAEPEWENECEAAVAAAPERATEHQPAFDMELHAPAAGDACLERYIIHGDGIRAGQAEGHRAEELEAAVAPPPAGAASRMAPGSVEAAPAAAAAAVPAADTAASAVASAVACAVTQGKLIVFPRPLLEPPLAPQPSRDELADPVNRRPRILEVPEDIMPAVQGSLFPEIRLDADEPEASGSREPEFQLPLRVAPVSARLTAALADLGVVLAGGGLFAAMAEHALPGIPHTKPFWMAMGVVAVLLWAIYQHLFLLYAGRTVGMSVAGIELSTFDGRAPQWTERRRRARFILISSASVALGFLWALVDEDSLCWHDRVSRTFPTILPAAMLTDAMPPKRRG